MALGFAVSGPAAVQQASSMFDQNSLLASQLGATVATNGVGPNSDAVRGEIKELRKDLVRELRANARATGDAVGTSLNGVATEAYRDKNWGRR